MSIGKAAALLGLGHQAVRSIPVDQDFSMRTDALRAAIVEDVERGLKPIAVVASAGTTATGSIDPIAGIAEVCAAYELWLHVDGAYGALRLPWLFQRRFKGLTVPILCPWTRTSGCISRSVVVVCSIAIPKMQEERFLIQESTRVLYPTIRSRGSLFSRNRSSYPGHFEP